MKLEWKRIFIIGLAFFSVSIAWGVYNSYVPVFLDRLIAQSTLVGFIMTFDNIAGLIFQPFFGKKSDTTKTRLGRRIPYMVFGVPIAAVFLILIPLHTVGGTTVAQITFLMAAVIGMNFFMSIYRAPAVALMPDATPSPLRSRANGVINFMGGFGSVAAFAVGGWLFKRGEPLPFVFAAVMMILALVALLLFYREPENPYSSDTEGVSKEKGAALFFRKQGKAPLYKQNPSLIFMLLSIFFWFCGYNGVETFFTLFCIQRYGMDAGLASQYLTFMAMTFLLFAIPSGLVGSRLGRKRTMLGGVVLMALMFFVIILVDTKAILPVMLIGAGIGWALININSYPTIVQMAPKGETGKYTGYYYAFSFSASIVSPVLFGFIADMMGKSYRALFIYGMVMFVLALGALVMVRLPKEEIEPHGHPLAPESDT